jgi:hypothetical protein
MQRHSAASTLTIREAMAAYIDSVSLARSANTTRTYRNGLELFQGVLLEHKLDPEKTTVGELKEDAIVWLAVALKDHAPTTERLYLTAATPSMNTWWRKTWR